MENVSQGNNNLGNHSLKGSIKPSETTRESVTKLRETLQDAGSQVGQVARHVVDDIKAVGGDSLAACSEEGKKQLETLKSYAKSAEDYVRENPVKSVFIGLAAGALVSKLFSTKR